MGYGNILWIEEKYDSWHAFWEKNNTSDIMRIIEKIRVIM